MFIESAAPKNLFAPGERDIRLVRHITLLWSYDIDWEPWFYKHLVPPGLEAAD